MTLKLCLLNSVGSCDLTSLFSTWYPHMVLATSLDWRGEKLKCQSEEEPTTSSESTFIFEGGNCTQRQTDAL